MACSEPQTELCGEFLGQELLHDDDSPSNTSYEMISNMLVTNYGSTGLLVKLYDERLHFGQRSGIPKRHPPFHTSLSPCAKSMMKELGRLTFFHQTYVCCLDLLHLVESVGDSWCVPCVVQGKCGS